LGGGRKKGKCEVGLSNWRAGVKKKSGALCGSGELRIGGEKEKV